MSCVSDDSTECDCETCRADEEQWERDQGWHDEPEDDECIGVDCVNPHPFHLADECATAEQIEAYETEDGES